jgi:CDP-diacylglycerol--glycerol-3-phosphate 3-phosphatidyltransferase
MANLITLIRFILLFILVGTAYQLNPKWQLVNLPLLMTIFILDAVDGYVARKRNEASLFGSIFDIVVDRIVENVLWLILVDLDFIPVWVAIVFITRSFLVDSIRAHGSSKGQTPFGMMRSAFGKFLVAGRFMRLLYGVIKAVTFGYIFLIQPWPVLFPSFYSRWEVPINVVKEALVYASVAICIARGLPVLIEFSIGENGLFAFRKKPYSTS